MSSPIRPNRKGKKGKGTTKAEIPKVREIPRNSSGGILISEDELERAFKFFDVDNTGSITSSDLRDRLSAFAGTISAKEIRFLLNGRHNLTIQDLRKVIQDNDVNDFDPYKEAFHWFDPQETGFMDLSIVKRAFKKLGYGEMMEEEIMVLKLQM